MRDEFLTTHWSVIEDVTLSEDDRNRALIGLLIESYWKPVYYYLRRKGYGNEQAKDLTQGFFHEVVLGRKLIARADQTRGRFRSFLLVALNRYVIDIKEGRAADKRIPQSKLISLDKIGSSDLPEPLTGLSAEDSFNQAWISALLEQVLDEVRTDCCREGLTVHWNVFCDRFLQPIMDNESPPSMKEICDKHSVDNGIKASNMIITVKRRLRTAMEQKLRKSVISDKDIGDELEEMTQFLSTKRAG
jgi:RNA polymerase sigma-70 factor (ECF subfamily)